MSPTAVSESVIHWLSRVDSHASPTLAPLTPSTPSKSPCISRKRRLSHIEECDIDVIDSSKRRRTRRQLPRAALRGISCNAMDPITSSLPSPTKRGRKTIDAPFTPQSGKSKSTSKSTGSSNPSTSSFPNKSTSNNENVRASLAKQGMWFEIEEAFDQYPEFQATVLEIVIGNRGSRMKDDSAKEVKQYLRENKTKDEKTFFNGLVPMVVKKARDGGTTRKRDAAGEILEQKKTFFATDDLDHKTDCQFLKNALPRRLQIVGNTLGLSDPKPDYVYGLKISQCPDLTLPIVSDAGTALIEVAPGLEYPWFVIENKGNQDSIESAETQAIRSGAALVSAQRQLAVLAGMLDTEAEPAGADKEHIAFSCSWVPQFAKIHVHWHEKRANGVSIFHMNLVRYYVMIDDIHVRDFRKDIHNVLDYGVSKTRKDKLREQFIAIAKAESSPKNGVGEGSIITE